MYHAPLIQTLWTTFREGYSASRRQLTLQEVVELVDTRRDAEVDGLVAEIDDDAAKDGGVHLADMGHCEHESCIIAACNTPCW